jgi:hypothetical protein
MEYSQVSTLLGENRHYHFGNLLQVIRWFLWNGLIVMLRSFSQGAQTEVFISTICQKYTQPDSVLGNTEECGGVEMCSFQSSEKVSLEHNRSASIWRLKSALSEPSNDIKSFNFNILYHHTFTLV